MTKAVLMDPQGTKPKGDGPQVFVNEEIKEDRFVIRDTVRKDFGRAMKPQGEEGGMDQKPI